MRLLKKLDENFNKKFFLKTSKEKFRMYVKLKKLWKSANAYKNVNRLNALGMSKVLNIMKG